MPGAATRANQGRRRCGLVVLRGPTASQAARAAPPLRRLAHTPAVRAPVFALCLLALAGCSSGSGSSATVSSDELPAAVLQLVDVGPGWSRFVEARQARIDQHAGPRSDTARFGRVEGWIARYRRAAATAPGPSVLDSRVDLFEDEGGANKDLAAYREELERGIPGSGATTKLLDAPELGDESAAGELRQGPIVFLTVAWRRANATASITAQGRTATTSLADVLRLARRQDRRLDRAAGK